MGDHKDGRYTGKLILEPPRNGQPMTTGLDFGFLDGDGTHWPVPPGTCLHQASIPKPLWSLIGDPCKGKYRDAAVVHEYHCAVGSMDWRSVHRMFYRAMLVSGVSVRDAKLVYAGVYFAGPRWQGIVDEAMQLGEPTSPVQTSPANILYALCRDPITLAVSEAIEYNGRSAFEWITSGYHHPDNATSEMVLGLDRLSDMVDEDDPSARDLEAAIDYAIGLVPCADGSPRVISVGRLARQISS